MNPWPLQYQFWLFFRPYFHYYLSSVHNCEDCFHFRFCNGSSHIWFLYIYSHWEYNLLFKKILICIPSFELFNFLVWISTTFKLYNCSDEKGYLKLIFIFRTLLKLGSLLWSRNIPLLVCRSYGFIGCMRIVLQEHCGKNHNIFFLWNNVASLFVRLACILCKSFWLERINFLEHILAELPAFVRLLLCEWSHCNSLKLWVHMLRAALRWEYGVCF